MAMRSAALASAARWLVARGPRPWFACCAYGPAIGRRGASSVRAAEFRPGPERHGPHWVNDLPGTLVQIRRILKPDGLLLAPCWAAPHSGSCARRWRRPKANRGRSWSGRVSPFADCATPPASCSARVSALPAATSETIDVEADNAGADARSQRHGREQSGRRASRVSRRATLLRAAEIYRERFTLASGRVAATFEVLFLHGWTPHESQPKPLKPGSAARRLADALGTTEQSAGEKAERT